MSAPSPATPNFDTQQPTWEGARRIDGSAKTPPRTTGLMVVPVPRHAPPDERRVAYMTLLADTALRKGRSLLPTGEATEALVTSGLIHEGQLPHVASAYMKTCAQAQARAWDAVPRSWTLPHGWQEKLGPARTQLVHALRAALLRNPAAGTCRTLLQYSAAELAGRCGIGERSVYRYLAADPEGLTLAQLLTRVSAEGERHDALGRRCPSQFQERLRNAYLRLFVRAWRGGRVDKATGRTLRWKYFLDVLPVDPIAQDELPAFLEALQESDEESDETGPSVLPNCRTEVSQRPANPAGPSLDPHIQKQREEDIRAHTQSCASFREEEAEPAVCASPHSCLPLTDVHPHSPLPPSPPRQASGDPDELVDSRRRAWVERHREEIDAVRRRLAPFVRRLTEDWVDLSPASTATRVATLLVAGAVPNESAHELLYAAREAARAAHVVKEGHRLPAFQWALQVLCIEETHPAWVKRPSERRIAEPWGHEHTIRPGERPRPRGLKRRWH